MRLLVALRATCAGGVHTLQQDAKHLRLPGRRQPALVPGSELRLHIAQVAHRRVPRAPRPRARRPTERDIMLNSGQTSGLRLPA